MSENRVFLDIPIEILYTEFKIEKDDPIKPILDVIKSMGKFNSKSETINRLTAISHSSTSFKESSYYSTPVIRDLWKGKYWTMKEKSISIEDAITGSIHKLDNIPKLDIKNSDGQVKHLVEPFQGWLCRKSGIDRKDILSHTRLESLNSSGEILFLRAAISQKQDSAGRKYWVHEEGPFKQLISESIHTVPGFEIDEKQVKKVVIDWPFAPEVLALRSFRSKVEKYSKSKKQDEKNKSSKMSTRTDNNQKEVIKESLRILDSIRDDLQNDVRPRLNKVEPVIGFRQDMWDAAQKVIKSAENQVFILTSFSNSKYLDNVLKMINEVTSKGNKNIILSFGEPDRGQSPKDMEDTKQYISSITDKSKIPIDGGISEYSNHSKIIISDTGTILIGSCNLFSGALDSGVLESGLLIEDLECAKSILEVILEEKWHSIKQVSKLKQMKNKLENTHNIQYIPDLTKKIAEIKKNLQDGDYWYAIPKLDRMLFEISERPVWSFVKNLQHRPFMEDCFEKFENRLVMASDGLRSNGLDKASIQRIGERATQTNATLHVWWGRHAPKSKPFDEIDKRGRKEAASRLNELRRLTTDSKNRKKWRVVPDKSNQPMENHTKMFIVDDMRLMITSDNTLSFGDTELGRGDAGELGIVIDHPRLALQTRGSMEAWLPNDAVIPNDSVRWWSLLAEEISLQSDDIYQKIPLENILDALIGRIESSAWLINRWENEIESKFNEEKILNKLSLGTKFGIFAISESNDSQGVKTRLSLDQLSNAVVSSVKKKRWMPKYQDSIDNALISALSQYKSKSGKRPHFILQGNRNYTFSFKKRHLSMEFEEEFVLPYLEKHRSEIIREINSLYGFEVEISWELTKKGSQKKMHSKSFTIDGQQITPKIWSESLLYFMKNPDKFEFISVPYNRMVAAESKLKLGSKKLFKYVDEECYEYLEWKREKNQLFIKRRA